MIGTLQLALVIAVPMQATAGEAALSMRAHKPQCHALAQFSHAVDAALAIDETYGPVRNARAKTQSSPRIRQDLCGPFVYFASSREIPTTRRDVSHGASSPDEWLGNDKLRHFLISMAVTQFTYGGLRTASAKDDVALPIAIGVAAVAGLGKEVYDVRLDRPFSVRDLAWDAAGIAIAGILLGSVR